MVEERRWGVGEGEDEVDIGAGRASDDDQGQRGAEQPCFCGAKSDDASIHLGSGTRRDDWPDKEGTRGAATTLVTLGKTRSP